MKRCPQCEFIYEDDQNACDMDGRALVYDNALASLPIGTPAETEAPRRSRLRVFALPACAGLLLAALICLAYWASPRILAKPGKIERKPGPVMQDPAKPTSAPTTIPSPSKPVTASPATAIETAEVLPTTQQDIQNPKATDSVRKTAEDRLSIPKRLPPLPQVTPLPRLPAARVAENNTRNVSEKHDSKRLATARPKNETTVKSFLKKTGRILKKPFRL